MGSKQLVLVHGKYFNSWEALGLGYIASYIKMHRPDVTITFFQGCFDSHESIVEGCTGADWVMCSCTTPSFASALEILTEVKIRSPETITVVGGYHPSAMSGHAPTPEDVDFFVVGEGEQAALKIINQATTTREKQNKVVYGEMMDLRTLPWPDREVIQNHRNIQVAFDDTGKRITSFQGHRACPFQCKYCLDGANKVLYPGQAKSSNLVRYRDVDDLVEEIGSVTEEYSLDLVKFSDPTWNTNVKWVEEFCQSKIDHGVPVPFYPNLHAGLVTENMARLMKEAGCYEVAVGVESGSPKVLKQIGKGTTTKSVMRGVRIMQEAGVIVRGYFILGMPDETEDDIRMTEEFAAELDLDEYGFTILCPYPGTVMYDSVKHKNVKWDEADEYSNNFWHSKHLSNAQLKAAQSRLYQRFNDKMTWHSKVVENA